MQREDNDISVTNEDTEILNLPLYIPDTTNAGPYLQADAALP